MYTNILTEPLKEMEKKRKRDEASESDYFYYTIIVTLSNISHFIL